MKRYRLTLGIALVFALWLVFGRDIIANVLNEDDAAASITESFPEHLDLSGRLMYTQGADGIWQIDLSSGEISQWWALPGRGYVDGIALAPDGVQLVIAYEPVLEQFTDESSTDLYFSPLSGPDLMPILERRILTDNFEHPFWSADSDYVYYSAFEQINDANGNYAGYVQTFERIPALGGAREVILPHVLEAYPIPGTDEMFYVRFDPDTYTYSLRRSRIDGSESQVVIADGIFADIASPRLHPNGESVIFSASGDRQDVAPTAGMNIAQAHGAAWDVWQSGNDGDGMTALTDINVDGPYMAWSPDGETLAILALEGVFILHDDSLYRIADSSAEGEIIWLAE